MNYSETMYKLINIIRNRSDYMPKKHLTIDFPQGKVGYYDNEKGDCYFELRYKEIDVTHLSDIHASIELPFSEWSNFNFDNWLDELENIIIVENTLIINGKKYKVLPE